MVSPDASGLAKSVAGENIETVGFGVPFYPEGWGVALIREWVADSLEMSLLSESVDTLVFEADTPAELAGIITAAVRLNLLTVCVAPPTGVFTAAVATLGFTPLGEKGNVAEILREAEGERGLRARRMVDSFSLANALRVALVLGGGSEALVHLAAVGREAEVVGFPRMARVLTPETPSVSSPGSGWYERHGLPGVLAHLGDTLRDTRTVSGTLKSFAAEPEEIPAREFYCDFVRARTSGAEVMCRVPVGTEEISGRCRIFDSEEAAVEGLSKLSGRPAAEAENAAADNSVGEEDAGKIIFVVRGCGTSGVPGLTVLDKLAGSIAALGLMEQVSVLTDGLAPDGAPGSWATMFTPEAAAGGVIGRLTNDDLLKIDLEEGRILTSVNTEDLSRRRTFRKPSHKKLPAYARRYAKYNLPPAEGGSFS